MTTTEHQFTPFIPSEQALSQSELPDLAVSLARADAKLAGHLAEATQDAIRRHMAVINSYYSNLIEGNRTLPHEIRVAQRGDYADDQAKRDLQLESVAHIHAQNWIEEQSPNQDRLYSPGFLKDMHREFYSQLPEHLREIKDTDGKVKARVAPGEWRRGEVKIGRHIPPPAGDLPALMRHFCVAYHPSRFTGDKKLIAVMCAHHRLVWIHPFVDGNGRIARLFTDRGLYCLGLDGAGAWCLSRGLARTVDTYKNLLARADFNRQGTYDGRGLLSEKNLLDFCEYMLKTAIDQIHYIDELLKLETMQKRIASYIRARNDERVPGISGKLRDVAALVLYHAFINGELEKSMAHELCGMPERSARRLLSQLKNEGLLTETSAKSPLRWAIPEHAEPWYFPELVPGVV